EHLVWWNCLLDNVVPPPEKWRNKDRDWLSSRQIELQTGRQKSSMMQRLHLRPVLQASESVMLVVPEQADGAEVVPSLLLGDLEAAFGPRYRDFNFHLNQEDDLKRLAKWFSLADHCHLTARPSGRPKPQLRITSPRLIRHSEYETPTNLDTLFYYPHRWFFRQKLKIYPGSLLSISRDETLQGNLSHRFFEHLLLQPDVTQFSRDAVREWIDAHAETLFPREGATLLLYGREPDRLAFLNKVKNAAWSLISMLRNNGWEVLHTEYKLEGTFVNVPVRGKADLILARGDERAIIDLKWSGLNRRKELIINGEDLQLVLYAHLLPPPEQWPHTAYFILKEGKMVARNALAFKEAIVAGNMSDHGAACEAILSRMQTTYRWRQAQFANGQLEVRNSRTALELEHLYEGHLFDLLEMKNEDDRWDEYRILLDR
ncbi:MAG: PD-(D/E)XK nuclease family protein, partial [Saprospiraceae bacterium]|nr:PD-(D/E)XK nuclease family protein [Saprospiraceae bacterium]